jgi:hypothetical protein
MKEMYLITDTFIILLSRSSSLGSLRKGQCFSSRFELPNELLAQVKLYQTGEAGVDRWA